MTEKISTFFAENGTARAEVWNMGGRLQVNYVDESGYTFHTEPLAEGSLVRDAEAIAEQWALKVLKG